MAATFVQAAKNDFTSGVGSFSVTFGSAIGAGSFIVVAGQFDRTATGVTISDTSGDAVTIVDALFDDAASGSKTFVQAFFAPTSGVAQQITATYSGTNPGFGDLYIWEFSGLTSPTFDKVVHATGTAAGADSGSSGTLSSADEAAIGYGAHSANFTAAGTGWSTVAGDGITTHTGSIGEHRTVAATTAINATATGVGGNPWVMHLATFKGSAAANAVSRLVNPGPLVMGGHVGQ